MEGRFEDSTGNRLEKRRAYDREWKKAKYAENPEPFRKRRRKYREEHQPEINARARATRAERRQQERTERARKALADLGRPPETLDEWFPTQDRFETWTAFGRALTPPVSRQTVWTWRNGTHPPTAQHQRQIYELTTLKGYSPASHGLASDYEDFLRRVEPEIVASRAGVKSTAILSDRSFLYRYLRACLTTLSQHGMSSPASVTPELLIQYRPVIGTPQKQTRALAFIGRLFTKLGFWTSEIHSRFNNRRCLKSDNPGGLLQQAFGVVARAHPQKPYPTTPVPILWELVLRCGLSSREICEIKVSDVNDKGVSLSNGRFISFGDEWEKVSRSSLERWVTQEKPTNYLFFAQRPIDRDRPVSHQWIAKTLRASGLETRECQVARIRRFADDLIRLKSQPNLLKHFRQVHRLSKSRSLQLVRRLQIAKFNLSSRYDSKTITAALIYDALRPSKNSPQQRQSTATASGQAKKRFSDRVVGKGRFCDRVIKEMLQIRRLYADSGRSIAEIQTNYPEFAAWKVRDTLPEEDRDVFNHPLRWGPTVGFGRLILGKHYSRHAETVKEWVKAFRKRDRARQDGADSSTP